MIYIKNFRDYRLNESGSRTIKTTTGTPLFTTNVESLEGFDFRNKQLQECRFAYESLNGADFSNTDLTKAYFYACDLRNVNFSGAKLEGATFYKCVLMNTDFSKSDLSYARIEYASEGVNCNFSNALLKQTTFFAATLEKSNFSNATFDNCRITQTRFNKSNFSDSYGLSSCGFYPEKKGTDLNFKPSFWKEYFVDLRGSNLSGVEPEFFKQLAEEGNVYYTFDVDTFNFISFTLAGFLDGVIGLPDYEPYKTIRLANRSKKMFGV